MPNQQRTANTKGKDVVKVKCLDVTDSGLKAAKEFAAACADYSKQPIDDVMTIIARSKDGRK